MSCISGGRQGRWVRGGFHVCAHRGCYCYGILYFMLHGGEGYHSAPSPTLLIFYSAMKLQIIIHRPTPLTGPRSNPRVRTLSSLTWPFLCLNSSSVIANRHWPRGIVWIYYSHESRRDEGLTARQHLPRNATHSLPLPLLLDKVIPTTTTDLQTD